MCHLEKMFKFECLIDKQNVTMGEIVEIHKFAVDSDNAEKIYQIFRNSYFAENNWQPFDHGHVEIQFDYAEGVLRLEERTSERICYLEEILNFFAGYDHVFSMSEYIVDGVVQSYSVNDPDVKYFVRPPFTEWELQQEELQNQRMQRNDDDLPF